MKIQITWRNKKRHRTIVLWLSLIFVHVVNAQNLVRNPNFTELDSCPYSFGQIHFAEHWSSDNEQSPDLYDSCVTGPFYDLPVEFGCTTITPYQDNGFVGIVTFGRWPDGNNIREIMTARINEVPKGVDIYCSMAVRPRPRCEQPDNIPNYICYTNGLGLAIIFENQNREIIFQSERVIDNINEWTILKGCYEAKGDEERVQIQNFSDNSLTEKDCQFVDDRSNISYTFVDNVVVTPFDILPDTLIVCDIHEVQFPEINFYDLPLSWDDGTSTGPRSFESSGKYTLLADAEACLLEETIVVIVADEEVVDLDRSLTKCEEESLLITIEIPGSITWNDNQATSSITVLNSGTYTAEVVTTCNILELVYSVQETDCNEVIYAGNIFSPNGDGINDNILFHLNPMLTIDGTIRIFDRWGTLVFESSLLESQEWGGLTSAGTKLGAGVYVWTFVSQDQSITQSGDITLIR